MHGNVNGYNVGSDIWVRYPVNQSLLCHSSSGLTTARNPTMEDRIGSIMTRSMIQKIVFVKSHVLDAYQSNTDLLKIEVGGGADYTFQAGLKLASGLYYGFISADNTIFAPEWEGSGQNTVFDSRLYYTKYPNSTENQIKFRLSAEKPISADYVAPRRPRVLPRMGQRRLCPTLPDKIRRRCHRGQSSHLVFTRRRPLGYPGVSGHDRQMPGSGTRTLHPGRLAAAPA